MPGAGLSWESSEKAPPDRLALKPYWGKLNVRKCVQRRLARSVGDKPTRAIVSSPVAWIAGGRETDFLKPIDKAIFGMVSESSGRNVSERSGGPESPKLQRPSPPPKGEGSMGGRTLTGAAVHSGGVGATARGQERAEQLERPVSSRSETAGAR